MIPAVELEVPDTEPSPILRSNNEYSGDLAYNPLQLIGEVEIAHSFREGDDSNVSSGEVDMASRFRTLGQKNSMSAANPPVVLVLLWTTEFFTTRL